MPICEVCYSKGIISDDEKCEIAQKLSAILLKAEGLEDNPISRSICFINISQSDSMYIGGKLSDAGKIVIKIYAFEDAYTDLIKQNLYSEITKIFIDENKYTEEQKGNNIWILILPIQHHNFGVAGNPVTLEITKKIVSSKALAKN